MADYNSTFTGQQVDTAVQKSIDLTTASRINTAVTKSEALDSVTDINNAVTKVEAMPTASAVTQAVSDATKVVANETPAGGESNLTEITISGTKYVIPTSSTPSNMVTTDTAQTITGNKTLQTGVVNSLEINTLGYINKLNENSSPDLLKIGSISFAGGTIEQQYIGCEAGNLVLRTGTAPVKHTTLSGNEYIMLDNSIIPNYAQLASIPPVVAPNGTYTLKATYNNGNVTFAWVLDT